MSEHSPTPTPWRVEHNKTVGGYQGYSEIWGPTFCIGHTNPGYEDEAEHLVRAVNSHDQMAKALENAIATFGLIVSYVDQVRDESHEGNSPYDSGAGESGWRGACARFEGYLNGVNGKFEAARAALAKAKGEA